MPLDNLGEVPFDLSEALSDDAIRRATGSGAYVRGAAYAHEDRVFELQVTRDPISPDTTALTGFVQGSRSHSYLTQVRLHTGDALPGARRPRVAETWCNCPVAFGCKHAAALMLVARAKHARERARSVPTWERHLGNLLRGTDDPSAGSTAIALQFDLNRPRAAPRYAGAEHYDVPARLSIRPVIWGRSGWVRSDISWQQLRYVAGYRGYPAAHLELLKEFDRLAPDDYLHRRDATIDLTTVSRALWGLLDQALDVGLPLVMAGRASRPVAVRAESATMRLDLSRAAPDADLFLRADVRMDGESLALTKVGFIGSPAHGCFTLSASDDDPTTLVRLDRPLAPALQRFLEHASELRIPAADATRFVEAYYPRLRQTTRIGSDDGSVPLPVVSGPRLGLTVAYSGTSTATLTWRFAYDVDGKRQLHPLAAPRDGLDVRDRAAETRLLGSLELPSEPVALTMLVAGSMRLIPAQSLDGMQTVAFTEQTLPMLRELPNIGVEIVGEVPDFRLADAAPKVAVSATDTPGRDWFDLDVTVTVDGHDVAFADLFAALAAGETHLVLDNGTYFRLDDPVFESLGRLIDEARALNDRPSAGLAINRFQAGLWEELVGLGVVERQSRRWATTVQGLLNLEALPEADPPAGIAAELRPYQLHGYRWLRFLWDHQLGGILADDMGLGKTLQVLALIASARADAEDRTSTGADAEDRTSTAADAERRTSSEPAALEAPFLVVAPTSVIGTWTAEAARFAPDLRVVAIETSERKRGVPLAEVMAHADVVITSYTLFRIDEPHYQALEWSALVLDEAQFVKNHRAKTYQCARKLAVPFKLAITGTPLENSLMDLWALLSIVAPGLFPQPKVFADLFAKPIERGDSELLATLRRRIRPLLLRRTKEQVATELPPKQESVLSVELAPRHRKIYETHLQRERQKILGLIDDMHKNRFTILRSLTLLRQLSLDPALVDERYDGVGSAKIDVLLEHLDEVVSEGHRALVFSQFTGFLRRVRDRLDAGGIGYAYLDGRTRKRAQVIEAFTSGEVPVFVISLKAGGFGLNLTEADYCFVLDPWWNPAVEAQAVDRTHRIGQRRTVMVYRLVSSDTIETKVMELKARKQKLFASVMDDDGEFGSALTADDIRGLLGA